MPYLSGIQYPSGRRIYCDEAAHCGEFIDNPHLAHAWPDQQAATSALDALIRFFEIRDPSVLTLFVEPCPSPP